GDRSLVRRQFLTTCLTGSLDGRPHDDASALGTRDCAADQQQVAGDVHLDDAQIFDGAVPDAHVTRHALALEHATRSLALTDGTRRAMRHRVTVSLHTTREI